MDATALARRLLDPIPAHRTAGLEVVRAVDGLGVVAVDASAEFANVIGSLHSSGLITLLDAAGLAAIIAAAPTEEAFDGVIPLGATASLAFRAPARGRLEATSRVDPVQLRGLYAGEVPRLRLTTTATITDRAGATVCEGQFSWSIRRAA
jgi:acyl-coenzyme A thioesterase PaaI-like protein